MPEMKDRGRIRVGAFADLTLFDPRTILDGATYQDPAIASQGVRHVLVNGVPVVRDGRCALRERGHEASRAPGPANNSSSPITISGASRATLQVSRSVTISGRWSPGCHTSTNRASVSTTQ